MNIIADYTFTLTKTDNQKVNQDIYKFVNKIMGGQQSVEYYKQKRNVSNQNKIIDDISLGKKAEYFALLILHHQFGFPIIELDMEIRTGHHKGWYPDLPFNKKDTRYPNIHVKACSQTTYLYCQDYSWTFQYSNNNNKGGKDSIFNSSNENLIAFVFLQNPQSNYGTVKAILPWSVVEQKLSDPKKKSLIGIKKCIYYQDLC